MRPYQALIWNEWRRMRGMFLAAAGATILLYLTLLVLTMLRVRDIDMVALVISYLLPGLLACIGFGAFQGELKSQTDSFLLSMPVSRGKFFWYKYLFNLSLYIVLAALCVVLFFPLAWDRAAAGKFLISGIPLIWVVMYLSVHGMAVTAPLMQNSRGGKVGGWMIALAFPALVIGIQAIVALYTSNEIRWAGMTMVITAFVLWLSTLGLGYYLWTNYLAFKRSIIRPLFAAAGTVIIFSAVLFTSAYIYSGMDLAEARREAKAVGLELEPARLLTPEAKNDALLIPYPLRQYQSRLDAVKPKLPSQSNNDDKYSWLSDTGNARLSSDNMRQAADFILNDPAAVELYAELHRVLNNLSSKFDSPVLMRKEPFPNSRLSPIDVIRNFLNDRAYALELDGRTIEAFECLELLDKLADSINNRRDIFYKNLVYEIQNLKFNTAINIGPDTLTGVEYYKKLLQELASVHPEFYDDTCEWLKYHDDTFGVSRGPLKPFLEFGAFLLSPRYHESIANLLRWQVAYKQLFEQAVTAKFTEVKFRMLNLDQIAPLIISISPYQIKSCYRQRTQTATLELSLALKIYKAKYGHFPETLAKLAPEILPVIPLDPVTGENFGYHAVANGFSLEIKSIDLFWNTLKFVPSGSSIKINVTESGIINYSYHTWNKNPDPAVLAAAKAEAETPTSPRNKRRGASTPVLTNTKEKIK